jgi:hypothetical protein
VSKMAILSEAPKAEITQIIRPQSDTVGLSSLDCEVALPGLPQHLPVGVWVFTTELVRGIQVRGPRTLASARVGSAERSDSLRGVCLARICEHRSSQGRFPAHGAQLDHGSCCILEPTARRLIV